MGLFKRIGNAFRANLSFLRDREEDPKEIMDEYLRTMQNYISEAENALAKQLALVHKLKSLLDENVAHAAEFENKAIEALKQNDEEGARRSLESKLLHQAKGEEYLVQYQTNSKATEELKAEVRKMKLEYAELKRERDVLLARARAARAQRNISNSGVTRGLTKDGLKEFENSVKIEEAEAKVMTKLNSASQKERELLALSLNEELEKLRKFVRDKE